MRGYLARRLCLVPVTVLTVTAVVFVMTRLIPGDPVSVFLGLERTRELEAAYRSAYDLDAPLVWQYVAWLKHVARGEWGDSIFSHVPVVSRVGSALVVSGEVVALAMLLTAGLGTLVGVLAATRPYSRMDRAVVVATTVGLGVPEFFSSVLLVLLFALKLGWLPATGFVSIGTDLVRGLRHLALPVIALALSRAPYVARVVRASMLEELGQDYVRTARMKGASEWVILTRHVLRNALLPAVTVMGLQMGFLLSGTIVVETIFGIPGLGTLGIQAIFQRDYPMVQGFTIAFAGIFVLTNLAVDLCYCVIDPRVRYGGASS